MKYGIRAATMEDIEKIRENSTENGKVDKVVVEKSCEKLAFTYNEDPIMILGLVNYPNGEYEKVVALWGLFSKGVTRHKIQLVKLCKDLLFERDFYTFVCYIDESEPKFKRFAEFFGFKPMKNVEEFDGKVYRYYIKRN